MVAKEFINESREFSDQDTSNRLSPMNFEKKTLKPSLKVLKHKTQES
jgi:hypothetical protein